MRNWRERDPEFSAAWDDAIEEAIQIAEGAVHDRAFEGVDRPVFQGGVEVGTVREYSDSLATFLLKAHRPERYRERTDIHLTGKVDIAAAILDARKRSGG